MKKLVKEDLNEKFEKNSDPIKDMGIGIPETSYLMWNGDDNSEWVADQLSKFLNKIGLYVYIDPLIEEEMYGNNFFNFIISTKELTEEELQKEAEKFNY